MRSTNPRLTYLHTFVVVKCVQEATSPVFTLDGLYLLYIDRGSTVIAYSLCDLAPRYHVPDCSTHELFALPVHHRLFLATSFDIDDNGQKAAVVSVADLSSRCLCDFGSMIPATHVIVQTNTHFARGSGCEVL